MDASPARWNTAELLAETHWVRGLAAQLALGTGQDPDDLVQDTWVAALEGQPGDDRPLRPWLRRVVRNRLAFRRRSEGRRRAREQAASSPEAAPATDELLERAEVHGGLVQALTGMREPYRSVLLLRYFGELAPTEIARRRGVPAATVRSHLHRGLELLRAEIDQTYGGDRRRAHLALLGLAGQPSDPRLSILEGLKAMNPVTNHVSQLILAASVALVTGTLLHSRLQSTSSDSDALEAELTTSATGGAPGLAHATQPPARVDAAAAAIVNPPLGGSQDEAKVIGVVVDRDDRPLPDFAIDLRHSLAGDDPVWSETEHLTTNAAGEFESQRAYPAGELHTMLIDSRGLDTVVRRQRQIQVMTGATGGNRPWDPAQGPIQVKARVGPTFTITLVGPEDLDPAGLTASLEAVEDEAWGVLDTSWIARGPVRAGDAPWIRFSQLYSTVQAERPWWLRVESADGLLAGEAQVQVGEHAPSGPVTIKMVPTARLEVSLLTGGTLESSSVSLEAVPSGRRRPMLPVASEKLPGGGSELRFRGTALPAGTYRVLVSVDDLDQLADTVTLEAGVATSRTIDLGQTSSGTRVAGEIRSQTGTYRGPTTVAAVDATGRMWQSQDAQWVKRDGDWVAPFAMDNLPAEGCELTILSMASHRRWSPLPMQIVPPMSDLILVCQDAEPVDNLMISLVDAATGKPLNGGWGTIELEGCERSETSISAISKSGQRYWCFNEVAFDALTGWYAECEGFVPRWGDASAFVPEKDMLVAEIALEPGWGARIQTLAGSTIPSKPLAGVVVLLDGEAAGVTDENGQLILVRETTPQKVEVAIEGWTYVGGDLDSESGQLSKYAPWITLRFGQ